MTQEKPTLVIKYVGYACQIDNSYVEFPTKEAAEAYGKEWLAREVAEWDQKNSKAQKEKERNHNLYWKIDRLARDLTTEAMQAGKLRRQVDEVSMITSIRRRIEKAIEEAEASP